MFDSSGVNRKKMENLTVATVLFLLACSCAAVTKIPHQTGKNTREDVVASLRQSGIDLKTPVQFEFFLYFDDKESADRSASEMRSFCQSVEVWEERSGGRWLCKGHKLLTPDSEETESALYNAKRVAANHNGELEAWEIDFGK